jgi:hypothetical protein
MTNLSPVGASTAPYAVAGSTSIAALATPKPVASTASNNGPAATFELSQAALARIKGDKDWKPGQPIDSW